MSNIQFFKNYLGNYQENTDYVFYTTNQYEHLSILIKILPNNCFISSILSFEIIQISYIIFSLLCKWEDGCCVLKA